MFVCMFVVVVGATMSMCVCVFVCVPNDAVGFIDFPFFGGFFLLSQRDGTVSTLRKSNHALLRSEHERTAFVSSAFNQSVAQHLELHT